MSGTNEGGRSGSLEYHGDATDGPSRAAPAPPRRRTRLFAEHVPPILTVGTPAIVRAWSLRHAVNGSTLKSVVRDIERRARFRRRPSDPLTAWWACRSLPNVHALNRSHPGPPWRRDTADTRTASARLAEPTRDVRLRLLVRRRREHLPGGPVLDHRSHVEKRCRV